MPKILHFADSHIDMDNYGRQDPETGLPLRVMDFLKSLDQIVDTAISEPVDCVIFAGDAYKNRDPAPTFQREWGKRIMRLSRAQIPTILLVGNHDVSPSVARAHAMEEFSTLSGPRVQRSGKYPGSKEFQAAEDHAQKTGREEKGTYPERDLPIGACDPDLSPKSPPGRKSYGLSDCQRIDRGVYPGP